MARRSLRPHLNQIRGWVRQGRTDAWVAHQLEVTVQEIRQFKRQNELADGEAAEGAAGDYHEEVDLRAEDDALIAAELDAAAAQRDDDDEDDSDSDSDSEKMIAAPEDRRQRLEAEITALEQRIDPLLARNPTHAPNQKLLKHLTNEREHLLTFLKTPGVAATNWRAEQAIRPAVVNRKNWGGNRTDHGAEVQQTLMSVIRSARQQDLCPIALLTDLLRQTDPAPSSMLRLPSTTTADSRSP